MVCGVHPARLRRSRRLLGLAGGAGELVPLPVLRQRVDRAWSAFQTSRYSILGPQLPQLLAASQLAARELDGDAKLRASGLLAETYQLAAILMHKLGESNAAWLAADRGILAADGDPTMWRFLPTPAEPVTGEP